MARKAQVEKKLKGQLLQIWYSRRISPKLRIIDLNCLKALYLEVSFAERYLDEHSLRNLSKMDYLIRLIVLHSLI
jgi:hypothetical protein